MLFIPPLLFADGWTDAEARAARRASAGAAAGVRPRAHHRARRRLAHALADSLAPARGRVRAGCDRLADRRGRHECDGGARRPAAARHAHPERREPDQRRLRPGRVPLCPRRARHRDVFLVERGRTLALVSVGGAAIGVAIAWIVGAIRIEPARLLRRRSDACRRCSRCSRRSPRISPPRPRTSSGILAVVAAGLYAGWNDFTDARRRDAAARVGSLGDAAVRVQRPRLPAARHHAVACAVGARRPSHLARATCIYALALWAALTVMRVIWVYPAAYLPPLARRRGSGEREGPRDPRDVFLVGWAGLRGSVTMAAALSIPGDAVRAASRFPSAICCIFLAASTIVLTLVLNGLTLPLLVRAFGVRRRPQRRTRAPRRGDRDRASRHARRSSASCRSSRVPRKLRARATSSPPTRAAPTGTRRTRNARLRSPSRKPPSNGCCCSAWTRSGASCTRFATPARSTTRRCARSKRASTAPRCTRPAPRAVAH